ncbi:hypothetical protein [Corynebacterium ulcerans]|uniref:hypothetical protein n=1 Tax=Corynebacterium ulcerans TaxID=65058 RepID=UPI0034A34A42
MFSIAFKENYMLRIKRFLTPILAVALFTTASPVAQAQQQESAATTISTSTQKFGNATLIRSITVTTPQDETQARDGKTVTVNPGDTINVKLELQVSGRGNNGFTSFMEHLSPIGSFDPSTGRKTFNANDIQSSSVTPLNKLTHRTFKQKDLQTIESLVNDDSFGQLGSHITYEYSYTAANQPGTFVTSFQMKDPRTKEYMEKELPLTVVVKGTDGGSILGKVFAWIGGIAGILTLIGGGVWHLVKNVLRL